MKKTLKLPLLTLVLLTAGAFASDVVLNIKLNGRSIDDSNHKVEKFNQFGIMVVEDILADTNALTGTVFFLDTSKHGQVKINGKNRKVKYYETEEVDVRMLSKNRRQFGMLVEFDEAKLGGVGRFKLDGDEFRQLSISSGHGAFLNLGFDDEDDEVSTNTVEVAESNDDYLTGLEAGKFSVRLNKRLTMKADGTNGVAAVEEWLESKHYFHQDEKQNGKGNNK
jgi:hypothetical protein